MAIHVHCPNPDCDASYDVAPEQMGRLAKCKKCGTRFTVSHGGELSTGGPTPSDVARTIVVPNPLGRYRIDRKLGEGGMGAVYLAHDTELDRPVALKVPGFVTEPDRELISRFRREARAAARLHHPNVCPVHDVGEIDGVHYLTMAYVEGPTLSAVLAERGALPEAEAAAIARGIALGVAEAHRHGIVHRDLKPSNVILNQRGEPVVMDFGVARFTTREESVRTETGQILGTPAYMSPEQFRGDTTLGPASDIHSLGVILYEMLTGRRPFPGPGFEAMGSQVLFGERFGPSRDRPGLSPGLDAICLRALAREPSNRFASMDEFAQALEPFALRATAQVPPPRPPTEVDAVEEPAGRPRSAVLTPDHPTSPAARRRNRLWVVLGGVTLGWILLGGLSALWPVVRDRLSDRGQAAKIEPPRLPDPISKNEAIAEPGPQRPIDVVSTPSPPDLKDMAPPVTPEAQPDRPVPVSPPPRERITNSLGMILVRIEPGEFDMGTRPEQVDLLIQQFPEATPEWFDVERPSHRVRITRAFHLGAHEVTVGQFRRFVEASGYQTEAERNNEGSYVLDEKALKLDPQRNWRNPGFPQGDDHPVVCVSHHDALAFIQWLNHQHPEESRSYRLPTEAEWEYVCRAGTAGLYGASDDPESLARVANVADASFRKVFAEFSAIRGDDGFVYTAPVGSFTPNTWGAYDMLGNVWEWCQDGYAEDYYRNAPRDDPPGSLEASSRVYRGGCWYSHPRLCRPAIRYGFTPEFRFNDLGFRVALGSSN